MLVHIFLNSESIRKHFYSYIPYILEMLWNIPTSSHFGKYCCSILLILRNSHTFSSFCEIFLLSPHFAKYSYFLLILRNIPTFSSFCEIFMLSPHFAKYSYFLLICEIFLLSPHFVEIFLQYFPLILRNIPTFPSFLPNISLFFLTFFQKGSLNIFCLRTVPFLFS